MIDRVIQVFLDGVSERFEVLLREAFEAGQEHEAGRGPDFQTYLKERRQ